MDDKITFEQAYLAMFGFLEDYYNRTKSDDIGSLLGGMSLMNDGRPMDMAVWDEWIGSVNKALQGNVDASMRLK